MGVHSLAEEQKSAEVELLADTRAGTPANDGRVDLRQSGLLVIREAFEELFADYDAQDGITEELEPLIRSQSCVGAGSMGEGCAKELGLAKTVIDRFLALLQNLRLAAGCQFLLHKTHHHRGC